MDNHYTTINKLKKYSCPATPATLRTIEFRMTWAHSNCFATTTCD